MAVRYAAAVSACRDLCGSPDSGAEMQSDKAVQSSAGGYEQLV
jgi:hypothetical protein